MKDGGTPSFSFLFNLVCVKVFCHFFREMSNLMTKKWIILQKLYVLKAFLLLVCPSSILDPHQGCPGVRNPGTRTPLTPTRVTFSNVLVLKIPIIVASKSTTMLRALHFSAANAATQNFSIPKTIIHYILENPQKYPPKLFYKLYFCCKMFYPKLKIIPIYYINVQGSDLEIPYNEESIRIPITRLSTLNFKLFIFCQLCTLGTNSVDTISYLFSQVWKWNLTVFSVKNQRLTLNEFKILVQNAREFYGTNLVVKNSEGSILPFEDLLSYAPNARHIRW